MNFVFKCLSLYSGGDIINTIRHPNNIGAVTYENALENVSRLWQIAYTGMFRIYIVVAGLKEGSCVCVCS